MNANKRKLRIVDYALPLDFGFLEVEEQGQFYARGFQVIYALSDVLICESVRTFQFDYELIFHQNIGEVIAHLISFVDDWKRYLTSCVQSARKEFAKQRPFINLLQIPSAEHIRNLISSTNYGPGKAFAFICVHLRQLSLLPASPGFLT